MEKCYVLIGFTYSYVASDGDEEIIGVYTSRIKAETYQIVCESESRYDNYEIKEFDLE